MTYAIPCPCHRWSRRAYCCRAMRRCPLPVKCGPMYACPVPENAKKTTGRMLMFVRGSPTSVPESQLTSHEREEDRYVVVG